MPMPVQTPQLTVDDRREDSNASKVWVGDSLVKDQTANTAAGRDSDMQSNQSTI